MGIEGNRIQYVELGSFMAAGRACCNQDIFFPVFDGEACEHSWACWVYPVFPPIILPPLNSRVSAFCDSVLWKVIPDGCRLVGGME